MIARDLKPVTKLPGRNSPDMKGENVLSGLEFLICEILIFGPSLLIVGAMTIMGWSKYLAIKPRNEAAPLIALTIALVPDLYCL